ncbi:hypothetical protein E1B28_002148 [Marasmius oreades]|uniref:Cytochrome P450 n=1 Tax=Marasmius oreades TaxID=181124 RepID=A0A9P7RMH5_9AGAR|nr:uncharacterized protein E1B28_002148 [Marasmius oreades]KAG7086187.1 hypothetical protein E1B28_002148 [Marasmius oreades]
MSPILQMDYGTVNILAATLVVATLIVLMRRLKNQLPLPPGPRHYPIIGNILDMPSSFPGHKFEAMGKKINTDILYLDVAGKNIVVLNSFRATDDLLEKRSANYSSRPRFTMVNELMGWNRDFIFMDYGTDWKAHRKLFQQGSVLTLIMSLPHAFTLPSLSTEFPNTHPNKLHRPHELRANRILLRNLLEDPTNYRDHLRLMAGSLLIAVTYGLETKDRTDPYMQNAEKALDVLLHAMNPGTFLVDSLPWLKHIPEWFPGAGFKRKAREWEKLYHKMADEAFDATKRDMANGTAQPSFVSSSLQRITTNEDDSISRDEMETLIRETAASMYEAGTDTVFTGVLTFFLAMTCFPEYQAKAQEEIDRVIGPDRLPDFEDRESLPYCEAIMQETFRWQPVGPVSVVHHTYVEDEYRGYRIPKNSTVIPNVWAILHDETMYPDPYRFNPNRWLTTLKDGKLGINPNIRDTTAGFGFGRRICPGRQLGLSTTFLTIATTIAAFEIQKALDENGKIIEPSMEFVSALQNRPAPFGCRIKPRSEKYETLICDAMDQL